MGRLPGCRVTANLLLHDRLAQSSAFIANITRHAPNWRRSIRLVGGYWLGDFTITPATMDAVAMRNIFDTSIGHRIVEKTFGLVTWEGEIVEMDLTADGVTWRITLHPERWQNKIDVRYTDSATGTVKSVGFSETTASSEVYGESNYIDTVGSHYNATVATARRDRRLLEFAFPQSVPAGALVSARQGAPQRPDQLVVRCGGYILSMNRRYQTADIAAASLSTQLGVLVGNSEFVTAGNIETNALSVPITVASTPQRLWDIAKELVLMGDAAGDRYTGGVYAGRVFDYEAAKTVVTHYWQNGQLLDQGRTPVTPSAILPNMVVQLSAILPGELPPGGNVWDSPRNLWVDEVEFAAPNSYRIMPYAGSSLGLL